MLAELLNAQIPFISIPLGSSADNHQLKMLFITKKRLYFLMRKNLKEN